MQRQNGGGFDPAPALLPGDGTNKKVAALVAIHLVEAGLARLWLIIPNVVAQRVGQPAEGVLPEAREGSIEEVVDGLGQRLKELVLVAVDTDLAGIAFALAHRLSLPEPVAIDTAPNPRQTARNTSPYVTSSVSEALANTDRSWGWQWIMLGTARWPAVSLDGFHQRLTVTVVDARGIQQLASFNLTLALAATPCSPNRPNRPTEPIITTQHYSGCCTPEVMPVNLQWGGAWH
jgi:hypothetical protein